MNDPIFVTPYTGEALAVLKVSALYLERIRIPRLRLYRVRLDDPRAVRVARTGEITETTGVITGIIDFVDAPFIEEIKVLVDEGIVQIEETEHQPRPSEADELLSKLFYEHLNQVFEKTDEVWDESGYQVAIRLKDPEIVKVHEQHIGPLETGARLDLDFVYEYYSALFHLAADTIARGTPVFSGSAPLRALIGSTYQLVAQNREIRRQFPDLLQAQLVTDVLKATLPDVSSLHMIDILEARHALGDELIAFRETMSSLHFDLTHQFTPEQILLEGQKIASVRLGPVIADLEKKITNSEGNVLKNLSAIVKNTGAYFTLLGAGFLGLSPGQALVIAAGLATLEEACEWKSRKDDLRGNGLFYLVQLRKKVRETSYWRTQDI